MLNNSNKKLKKIIISSLIVALTYSNFVLVGSNLYKGLISYAEDNIQTENEDQMNIVCDVSVKTNDIHKTTMTEDTTQLNEEINLKLKNVSKVLVQDLENTFYNLEGNETEDAKLKYEKTKLNKEDLVNILGSEGSFEVLDEEDMTLAKISLEKIAELENLLHEAQEEDEEIISVSKNQVFTKTIEEENDEGELEEKEVEEIRSNIRLTEDAIEISYELEKDKLKFAFKNINTVIDENAEEYLSTATEDSISLATSNEDDTQNDEENGFINFVIENTKSIYEVQDLENLNYLKEDIDYNFNNVLEEIKLTTETDYYLFRSTATDENVEEVNNENEEDNKIESIVNFKDTITRARLETGSQELELGKTNAVDYKVVLDTTSEKAELFKNPTFIIELPEAVESVNSQNSQFTVENGEVFTEKHVTVATLAGRKYIVIQLEGEQTEESIQNGDTAINLSLELTLAEGEEETQTTKLYYQNDTVTAYESGAGFDTDETEISLVLASEEKEEINEEQENTGEQQEENIDDEEKEYTNPSVNVNGFIYTHADEIIKQGEQFEYIITVNNYEEAEVEDVVIIDLLPEGVSVEKVEENDQEIEYDYNNDTRELIVALDKIDPIETIDSETQQLHPRTINITVRANLLEEGTYSKNIINYITIKKDEEVLNKADCSNTISDSFLEITKSNLDDKYQENDDVSVELSIENKGLLNAQNVNIKVTSPTSIEWNRVETKTINGEEDFIGDSTLSSNEYNTTVDIISGQIFEVTLEGKVIKIDETLKQSIKGYVNEQEINWETTLETVKNNEEPIEEKIIEGHEEQSGDVEENNNKEDTNTDENHKDEQQVDLDNNNDNKGTEKDNIDNNVKFDLSLSQSLKKITVTNNEGTTTYNYENTKFAKLEIPAKYMNGSMVTFEYEITVKNEGTIPGYARKIVNYISNGLTFNSELNSDWYVGDDGNIYSVALIDKLLNPGDTAKVKLVLTKQMTNTNTGTVTSIAEIYEASNDDNIEDINSIPGDKLEGQNDMAKVEALIGVKTGSVAIYTILTIIVLSILGYGTYIVKKLTVNRKGGC